MIEAISAVYETEPVGHIDQPAFLNAVVRCRAPLEPAAWVAACLRVESAMGRIRSFRDAPRLIDLDVLLVEDRIEALPGARVPHPRMAERAFVLVPLLELDPEVRDPRTGRPLGAALADLPAGALDGVVRIMDGEELLAMNERTGLSSG